MNITHIETRRSPPDALYEFSLAATPPTADLLEAFVRRYPEHAEELTELAVALMVDSLRPKTEPAVADQVQIEASVTKAMSRVLNLIHEIDSATERQISSFTNNPIAKLDRGGLRALGERLRANSAFVMMLRDREIDVTTTTDGFRQYVAEALSVPSEALVAHLAAPRIVPQGMHFMSNVKPQASSKVAFSEAIRKCGLTSEQIAHLSKL